MSKKFLFLSSIALMLLSTVAAQASDFSRKLENCPVSFIYGGTPFDAAVWPSETSTDGAGRRTVSYLSPDGRLRLRVEYREWNDFPVVEIRPVLECVGTLPTAIIDDFKSIDLTVSCSDKVRIRRTTGSRTSHTDFARADFQLEPRHELDYACMTSQEGRHVAWLPYFGVDFSHTEGMEIAIGWTGTWRVDFRHLGQSVRLASGLTEGTHFKMLPGESFAMPYTVIYKREGQNVEDAGVDFHRFIIKYKSPRNSRGELFEPLMPIACGGGNKSDESMLRILDFVVNRFKIPFDTFWVDANWYGAPREVDERPNCGTDWYDWAGLWRMNTVTHPDGNLKRVSDAVHAAGMRFLLWFEPERASLNTPILAEHPEYFHHAAGDTHPSTYLLDLGNPDAFNWIVGEVSRNIVESGVDIYRQDFNLDPLPIWRTADAPDRRGVSEIKHINGLYAFWDELHRRFPDMMFENCASGGTRMDIEMMSRAHSYCRDDAHMSPGCDELTQNITLNTTSYIPFTGGETFTVPVGDTYAFLSRLGAGAVITPTDFDGMILYREPGEAELEWFRHVYSAAFRMRPLFCGDFYKLTDHPFDSSDVYCGYQLDNPETGEGCYIVFRRKDCEDSRFWLRLRGIDPDAKYIVEEFEGRKEKMKGSSLSERILEFDEPRSYRLVFYKKQKNSRLECGY